MFISTSSPRRSPLKGSRLTLTSNLLHCDKVTWFCHIEASAVLFDVRGQARQLMKSASGGCKVRLSEVRTSGLMSVDRKTRAVAAGVLLLSALALGGCATSIADMPLVGTPADAPARPKEAGAYLPVHDLPPDREEAAMAPSEQAKVLNELAAARDRQASAKAAKKPGRAATQ